MNKELLSFTSRLPLKHFRWTFTNNNLTALNKLAGHQIQVRRPMSDYDAIYQKTKQLFLCKLHAYFFIYHIKSTSLLF